LPSSVNVVEFMTNNRGDMAKVSLVGERPPFDYLFRGKVLRWVDGDTVLTDVDVGFGLLYTMVRWRLAGINTHEISGRKAKDPDEKRLGLLALDRVLELAPVGETVLIRTIRRPKTKDFQRGSFGRYLPEMWPSDISELRSINQILLDEGLADVYNR